MPPHSTFISGPVAAGSSCVAMADVHPSTDSPSLLAPPATEPPASSAVDKREVARSADDIPAAVQQQTWNGIAAAAAAVAAVASDITDSSSSGAAAPSTPAKPLFVSVDEPSSNAALDVEALAAIHRWLACVCVITFDLEMGPTLEYCYPSGYLSQAEITNGQPSNPPDHSSLHIASQHVG